MNNYQKVYLTKNECYKNGTITPMGIMVHSTGANNPNVSRYVPIGSKYSALNWNRAGLKKCVHGFLGIMPNGEVDFVQTLPFNKKGWHAGPPEPGKKGANNTHIGFECCEDNLKDEGYFRKVWDKAVEVCAYLCKLYNLNPLEDGVIISHHEGHLRGIASNHADIDHWFKIYGLNMDDFREAVYVKMKEEAKPVTYEEWTQQMKRYLEEEGKKSQSEWAADHEVCERISRMKISDGKRPRQFATRQEVFLMLLNVKNQLEEMIGGKK